MSDEKRLEARLTSAVASEIAELTSQLHDMHTAHRFAELYLQQPAVYSDNPHGDIRQALWTASLITYRRIFVNGVGHGKNQHRRPRGSEWLKTLPPDLLAAHDEIHERASHHIAHRTNKEMQQISVFAVLTTPPKPREVVEVQTLTHNLVRPASTMVHQMMAICTHLIAVARERRNLLCNSETDRLNAQVDLERLYRDAELEV